MNKKKFLNENKIHEHAQKQYFVINMKMVKTVDDFFLNVYEYHMDTFREYQMDTNIEYECMRLRENTRCHLQRMVTRRSKVQSVFSIKIS